jgi:hypothetical protein
MTKKPELVFPGIWRITLGKPEDSTPVSTRQIAPAANSFGDGSHHAVLYDDDGTNSPTLTEFRLTWDTVNSGGTASPTNGGYSVREWKPLSHQ